jgi:hypothetical protein
MKKFFSLIALVGVFAACQPEKIQTAFTLAGGSATINVKVVDINNHGDYSGTYTLTSSAGTVSGNTVTISAGESTKLAGQTVTVTVNGPKFVKPYTYDVLVPDVLPGGQAAINAIIVVGEGGDYSYEIKESDVATDEEVEMINVHDYPVKTIDGVNWYVNESEFLLEGDVEYDVVTGSSFLEGSAKVGFEGVLSNLKEIYTEPTVKVVNHLPITVSAYAIWRAFATYTTTLRTLTVTAKNNKTGETFEKVVEAKVRLLSSTQAEFEEKANPDTHGHYVHGQGEPGGANNAGGGIVYSE